MASTITFTEYIETGPLLLNSTTNRIHATFRVAPIHVTVANTLRRQILSAVPTVGFKTEPPESSDVYIGTNTTPLVNEMLIHRIGMIPICVLDPSTFNPEDYEFRLNIENLSKALVNVTASDFTVVKTATPDQPETTMDTKLFFPPDPITNETALITVLRPRYNMDSPAEKLHIRAKASIGTGRDNMRYSSITQCSYEYTLDPNKSRQNSRFITWLATSKKVPDSEKISVERQAELRREFDSLEIQRCYLENEKGEPYDFVFHVESVGIFSVPTIIERGLAACEDLVTPYITLDADMPDTITVGTPANRMAQDDKGGVFEFTFRKEEHTLGNLLQTFLVERHIEGTELPRMKYAGYRIPHPLKQEMVLTICPVEGDVMNARKAIANVCKFLKTYFADAKRVWQQTPKGPEPTLAPTAPIAPTVKAATATKPRGTRATAPK
jgi:DNA-directed RNA polymerase subunit L/DNA-directed RNA polymerase alpha subunit